MLGYNCNRLVRLIPTLFLVKYLSNWACIF